ncbi:MAG TPA: transglutaminase domain-containing protein [Mucilaginibacter sp.]|nr:transglutaminase domain-containing protein [Mucilaginibacter sp.]
MNRPNALFFVLFLSLRSGLFAQQRPVMDFRQADSLALTVKYNNDISGLTRQLTGSFADPILKTRAIFRWITDNIAYDCKYYNKYGYEGREPKSYKCGDDSTECDIRRRVWENMYINNVLDQRKGVCQGYAMLFKKMCGIAGIECEIIPGYVRTEYYEVGTPGNLDHAWNAVRINGNYFLVDATWGAGGCSKDDEGKLKKFNKNFNDYYWFTPPEEFARNHFPEDPKWVLIKNYTKDNFLSNPYYDPGMISDLRLIAPASGVIHTKRGDTLRFKIAYSGQVQDLQINTNTFQNPDIWTWEYVTKRKMVKVPDSFAMKKQQYIKYRQSGDVYEFAYVVKDNSLDYLDIMFDRRRVMRFKVTYR